MLVSLPQEDAPSYRFGSFELDVARKQLRRDGEVVSIAPKPLALLGLLVSRCSRMVSRDEALAGVWPDVCVSDATLASTLRDLRRVLGDDAQLPRFIQTARGLGFRFVAPVASGRPPPAFERNGCAPLVGRRALLERLEDALAAATGGHGRLLLLEGEPGIGKTRALAELSVSARASNALVCQARFPEAGAGPAYRPWSQLLTALVEARPPERLAEEIGPGLPWIARLVPGLTARSDGPEPDTQADDETTTLRLFEAVTGFLRRVSRSVPLVLVLDDLQGADRSSLRLLEYLADEIHDERILVAGAYRSCELDPEHPLPATLAELARGAGYARHRLEGVDLEATAALVVAATGCAPSDAELAEIHARTDGNPFYVSELARFLAEQPAAGGNGRAVPPSLCELLRGRLQRLPLRCRDTLELASVIGREFEVELLRRASGLDISDLTEALVLGRRAGLVELGWGATRRFRHALVQEAIYAGLPDARRRLLHRRVGEAARALVSVDRSERLATVAHHLCEVAEEVGIPAFEAALAAAEHAEAQLAFEEAERLYALALDALDRADVDDRVRRCPLLLALARSRLRAGSVGLAVETMRRAVALARKLGRPDLLAEAALLFSDYVLADGSELQVLLQEALATLGPEHRALRGRCFAALSTALWYEGQGERRLALADEAIEIAGSVESSSDLVAALLAKHHTLMAPQHLLERLRLVDRALREADRRGNDAQRCQVLSWRAADLMESGDRAAAERDVARLEEIARATRHGRYLDPPGRWRALLAMMEGRFEEAEHWIAESAAWRKRADLPNAQTYALIQQVLLMRERGRQKELAEVARTAPWLDEYRTLPAARSAIALLELEGGFPHGAQRVLADYAASDYEMLATDPDQLYTASWLAEICVLLDAHTAADALYERLVPWRDRVSGIYAVTCRGSMARYLGLLAVAAGRTEEAADCFEAALEANRALGASLFAAWTQWEYARLLGARGDCVRAGALAKEARVAAGRMGLGKLAHAIDRAAPDLA
jgi:DNA-binding winged helix-turn-helix (wHTH) protein/tetratricopeptide (TPR) repeat protein